MKDSKVIYTEEGQEVIPKTTPKRPSKPSGQKKYPPRIILKNDTLLYRALLPPHLQPNRLRAVPHLAPLTFHGYGCTLPHP